MILDVFYQNETEITVSYLPVWEMFFSMHVLAVPEHHMTRQKWAATKEERFPELVEEIRALKDITGLWTFIIDSGKWSEIRQMEIAEMISFFRKKNIYEWNEWARDAGKAMTIGERDRVLDVIERYYNVSFRKEDVILRTYLTRVLEVEKEKCKASGVWEWCRTIHNRLMVDDKKVTYLKNREYMFRKEDIRNIFMTASTFVSPHLWLYAEDHGLEIVKGISVEKKQEGIPEDFVHIFRALGDGTRLRIVKNIMRGISTTQALAAEMGLSEAAVSKHLKILWQAGLVTKEKQGMFMKYKVVTDLIDFIPYTFYEMMMK